MLYLALVLALVGSTGAVNLRSVQRPEPCPEGTIWSPDGCTGGSDGADRMPMEIRQIEMGNE